ncbi:TetR/AcrR family transcriptional regulator [Pseudomonas hefeiensis]|uniref:TetR/AcrR family transcriptional regulator n=1 Tax=Pseudomonas hefeiensis TaxID=2738125 RepID=A0ABY9GGQ2_9PSED|nr:MULTISPECIES: TetR/AcrR family transcriptional regulator [unclassified Pseudomonas]WLH14856.1 TetR/AcrR family transcriptional regulator [Pseudomonas sp. FP205]WLH97907.1 TetR/AcrR family transcriptional regulator [Pseudomonas sp. FP53]WLI42182.1 TetR/AcrR family transcriptional regulator [Pseudomonas sp. FP821]
MTSPPRSASSRSRTRLTPEVRSEKILESALAEFSRQGFIATRIEDIARGAGLAKSGFYGHFRSKEEVFETLLTRLMVSGEVIAFAETDTVVDFVDRFIDFCYTHLLDTRRQAVLRLLLVEMHRIPALIQQWRREVADPLLNAQVEVLHAAVARGQLADGPILKNFRLAYAPVLYWVLANRPQAQDDAPTLGDLDTHRQIHRQMMLGLLCEPAATKGTTCSRSGSSS